VTYTIYGTATVSVYIELEASSEIEARKLADKCGQWGWKCDEVDGKVTITEIKETEDF
jgi:hypothetical protein